MNITEKIDPKAMIPALEFEGEKVRRLKDGSVSVIDMIRVVGGYARVQAAWTAWNKIARENPEVSCEIVNLQFPGAGQRPTPVASKRTALQILGLLPGRAGDKYRKEAADLMLQWYESPADLAIAAMDRVDNAEDSRRILEKAAEQYITKYHPLFSELKGRGADKWTYINVNTLNTQIVLKKPPKDIVLERGGETARSNLTSSEYIQFAMLQDIQRSAIVKSDPRTKKEAYEVLKDVATEFEKLLSKYS